MLFFHTNSQTYGNVTRAFPVKMLPALNVWKCIVCELQRQNTKSTIHTHICAYMYDVRIIVKLYNIYLPRIFINYNRMKCHEVSLKILLNLVLTK